jgi:hypothetical protein
MRKAWQMIWFTTAASCLAVPSGATTPTKLPSHGGAGGSDFEAFCNGRIVRGVQIRVGDDVDAIRPVCANVQQVTRKIVDENIFGPWHGGPRGEPRLLMCPADSPAVYAMSVGAEGDVTYIVNSIGIWCGNPDGSYRTPTDAPPDAIWTGPRADISGGGIWARFSITPSTQVHACPPGQAAGGLHGSSGVWLDAVGLTCISYRGPIPLGRSSPLPPPGPPPSYTQLCQSARKSWVVDANATVNYRIARRVILLRRCLEAYPGGAANSRNPCVQAKVAYSRGQPYEEPLLRCFANLPPG